MIRTLIFAVACLAPAISAAALPQETGILNTKCAAGPAPTNAPKLMRRDDDTVCGYVNGDSAMSVGCDEGEICRFWAARPQFSSSAAPYVANGGLYCYPRYPASSSVEVSSSWPLQYCSAYQDGKYNTASESITYEQGLYCGSGNKECATFVFEGDVKSVFAGAPYSSSLAAEIYTHLACGPEAGTYTIYATATN